MTTTRVPNVLAVAGSDPSGGAGVQADLKTFAAFGVYGAAVITALTAQNARELVAVRPVDADFVALQLRTVFDDANYAAIKIGMLGTSGVAKSVADVLSAGVHDSIVIDPVLRASAGAALLDDDGLAVLRDRLVPLARVITPNADEAGMLLGRAAPASLDDMHTAAHDLVALGAEWALVTGGHVDTGNLCVDVLAGRDGEVRELRVPRAAGPSQHGTGCTLSSAIAALLASGHDVPTACAHAQAYVAAIISSSTDASLGDDAGPLIHIPYSPFMAALSI